jgi:hypothetical protein
MFIHIGNREIISDAVLVGIFNRDTIDKSELNAHYSGKITPGVKSIIVDYENNVLTSDVSSYTIIKRIRINDGIVWRREDDQRV